MGKSDGPIIVRGKVAYITDWKENRQSSRMPRERGIKFKHTRNGTEYEDWANVLEDSEWANVHKKGVEYQFEKLWDEKARNGKGGYYYIPHGTPGNGGGGRGRAQEERGRQGSQNTGRRQNASQGASRGASQDQRRRGQQGRGSNSDGWDSEPQHDRPTGYHELVKFMEWLTIAKSQSESPLTILLTQLVDDGIIMGEQARWSFNQAKRIRRLVSCLEEIEQNQD